MSRCEVPESACDQQEEQGTEHYDTAVVNETIVKRTKQSLIAQAGITNKSETAGYGSW